MSRKLGVKRGTAVLAALMLSVLLSVPALGAVSGTDVLYTTDADFDQGTLVNVNHEAPNNDQLQLNTSSGTFPFIWVALSQRCTIAKINTATGAILGEYRTISDAVTCNQSSRTTVGIDGSVWVGHRGPGGVNHVGLVELNQCVDRDGSGTIQTSTGYGDVKPWPGATSDVATAQDECILHHVNTHLPPLNMADSRHMSIDASNKLWVGDFAGGSKFVRINGTTGVVETVVRDHLCGGYGGLIDGNGVIWSAQGNMLRWNPDLPDAAGANPRCLSIGHAVYGVAIDGAGSIWTTALSGNSVRRTSPDGNSTTVRFPHGNENAQGLAVDSNGDVWVSSSLFCGSGCTIGHLKNNGTFVGEVPTPTGAGSTGIAVDAAGKIWAANLNSNTATRIDPALGPLGCGGTGCGDGTHVGAVDLTVSFPATPGRPLPFPYNYSDMTGAQLFNSTAPQGSWTVVQDSGSAATEWGTVTWNTEAEGSVPPGTAITVEARAADTEAGLGAQPYVVVSNGVEFALFGRFIQVRATLEADDDGNSPVLSDIRIQALANDPATLELTPETDTNTAGDEHCVVATVEDQSGAPVEDVIVDFSVSGPNGPLAGSDLTDANGQADFCYTGTHAGDDTITATAQGGTNPSDTATKTYAAAAPATLDVEPATATNVAGDEHCVTATVEDEFGNPVPGVTVDFAVSGPNANGGVGVTDANGVASFCYTGTHAGDDTITATAVGGTAPSDTATKTWQPDDPATLDLGPPTATNTAGDEHCVTATVRDQFDNPVPGVTVNFAVFGANTNGGAEVTDANGVAVFCYTGTVAGDDDIVAMAVGGTNPSDTAEKTWEPDAPATLELAPTGVTNTVDEEHCVTATVRDQFGNPTPGITVHFSVSPTTFRTPSSGSSVTDASGEAEFCYTSAMPGGDVISAFADANGNGIQDPGEPSDTATKTWVIPANQVGCMVTYGATFTAANGDRASAGGNAKGAGPSGQEQFQDHGPVARMNVHSINVLSVTCSPDDTMASIFGEATIDGAGSFDYRIDLKDPSGPGPDTYRIRLGNGYDSGEQAIRGNVQIH